MEIIKGYDNPRNNCKKYDIQSLKDNLDTLDLSRIIINAALLIDTRKIVMCDIENPIMFVDNFFYEKSLCIDEEYYNTHISEIEELVLYICSNTKMKSIKIDDGVLINDKIINAILNNPNLEEVSLGCSSDGFVLTEEIYERLKNTNIKVIKTTSVVESLESVFDPLIGYNCSRSLIGYDNYEMLSNGKHQMFQNKITEEEMKYLKIVNKDSRVSFYYEDYKNVFECIRNLRENGHKGVISIQIKDKNTLNSYIFSNISDINYTENVEVYLNGSSYPLATYIKYEKKLIDLIMPAINLSPFEKYLFAYNVTKKFKKYKENEDDRTSARDLYQIFDNEFMVCVGYSKLLGDLLNKLGIESYEDSVVVDTGLDIISSNDDKPLPDFIYDEKTGDLKEVMTEGAGHARRKIHLVDPKYGIDGYYFADPTWDNDMKHDTYNYALMTEEEYIGTDRYNYYSLVLGTRELFFIHSLEEFYFKINFYLDKNRKKSEVDVLSSLLDEFSKLDREFYQSFISKYGEIKTFSYTYSKEQIQDMLLDIGERILQKTDNIVDGKLFKEGIYSLYKRAYGLSGEELEIKVNEIMEYNKKRHAVCFPTRYKIDRDDNRMILHNMYNKFDIDIEPKLGI